MSDLIDRQAAIDAIKREQAYYAPEDGAEIFYEYNHAIKALKNLPSAQPTAEPKWIPVTERLPEVRQWVLCQCRAGIIDVLWLTDDDCWYRKSNEIYMSGFVLAWMPLPSPYEP